jgi:putative tryptophan/tyrosine transport system substrate-binding protein
MPRPELGGAMRRREFISLLGGLAAVPLTARAQQPAMPMVGYISGSSAAERAPLLRAFHQGLSEAGYFEGRNVKIEYRYAEGKYDRMPAFAADLIHRGVTAIFAGDGPSALVAKAATTTIPIVFNSGGDVVQIGLVANLNRPGGNITGVNLIAGPLAAKQLEILHELVSKAKVVAFLINPENANAARDATTVQEAARLLGVRVIVMRSSTKNSFDDIFSSLIREKVGGLLVNADVFFTSERDNIVALSARHGIPTIYAWREFCEAGGLISYGPSLAGAYRQCGLYIGKVLSGTKPSELPVIQPTKFELVVNLKTAKTLGLTVPPTLVARADEAIE